MFEQLKLDGLSSIGLENLDTKTLISDTPTTPPTPPAPPQRFGAIRIKLDEDGWNSKIHIKEYPNVNNTNDYVVILNKLIPGEAIYSAELITLLNTLTAQSTVTIRIASPGGSLYTGAMIASAIKTSQAKVITIACGIVASAAALIWSYGHECQVEDQAVILFHMSSHGDWGNSEEIRIKAENIVRYVKEVAIDPMIERGMILPEEAEQIIDKRQDLLIPASIMRARLEAQNNG